MQYLVGLDIGCATIKAAIAEVGRGQSFQLISVFKLPSGGIRRGTVDNVIDATHALSAVLTEVKKISRGAIKNIILGVATPDMKVQYSKGVVAVSRADDEIYQDDISRVIQSAQAVTIPANRMVIHSLIKEFIVDGIDHIADPLGMIGKRLEVSTLIIDAFSPSIKNLEKCVETLGASVSDIVLAPLATSHSVLTKNQKELGVILIDLGFSKTSIAVYVENRLAHAAVIPVGSGNITNDLAIGLRIPIETAEIVKLSFGSALAKEVSSRDAIELAKIDPRARGTVTKKFIAEIIEDRLAEIFELVNNEVKQVGKISSLPAGVVLVGAGVKIANIAELARSELKLSAQIGVPNLGSLQVVSGELALQAEDPEFATALGLLLYERDITNEQKTNPEPITKGFKKILSYFIP